jgi:imidazolonepropionase-like amidohydrolase
LDGINFWDLAFTDALRGGVTRSLTMPGSANLIGGQAVFLKHLAARPADMVYKHPWGLKAALGENPKRVYAEQKKSPITRMANASLLREALYTAARNMDRIGFTCPKSLWGHSPQRAGSASPPPVNTRASQILE